MYSSRVIFIPQGSIRTILADLNQNKDTFSAIDALTIRLLGNIQSGWIDLGKTTLTKADFLHHLLYAKAALKPIKLLPGETTYFVLNDLGRVFGLDRSKLEQEYKAQIGIKEGFFIPETYNLPIGITEKKAIAILAQKSQQIHEKLAQKLYGIYDKKQWFKLITIASIIQKEAANKDEMPLVSSVIYNRIVKNMRLQMDGTLNYGKFSHIRVTPKKIRSDTSDYNTYKKKGLPKNPVCIVSKEAINAAFSPAKTKYLYFVRTKKGEHTFSETFKQHHKNFKAFPNK